MVEGTYLVYQLNNLVLTEKMFMDNKFRKPRIWSNKVLKEMAYLFEGNVGNISGWKDNDKQGKKYRSYFKNASRGAF